MSEPRIGATKVHQISNCATCLTSRMMQNFKDYLRVVHYKDWYTAILTVDSIKSLLKQLWRNMQGDEWIHYTMEEVFEPRNRESEKIWSLRVPTALCYRIGVLRLVGLSLKPHYLSPSLATRTSCVGAVASNCTWHNGVDFAKSTWSMLSDGLAPLFQVTKPIYISYIRLGMADERRPEWTPFT